MDIKKRLPYRHNFRFYNNRKERTPSSWFKRVLTLAREARFLYHGFKQYSKHGVIKPKFIFNDTDQDGIWWIGHATFIIKLNNCTIITDPVFGSLPLVSRLVNAGIDLENIPHVDYVLISHNHWDHLNMASLRLLYTKNNNITFCVPKGDLRHFKDYKKQTLEWNWWQTNNIGPINLTFLPSKHWSQSSLFDRNKSLWGSWLIKSNKSIYFGGDSSFDTHFKEIAYYYPNIDYALLPIGPCEPREVMCHSHMGPEESLDAFSDLGAKVMIPMHWGTFSFGLDDMYSAIERLKIAMYKKQIKDIKILEIGEQFCI